MKKYKDLELVVLSCLLQNSELMQETILTDKYFLHYKRTWYFLKAFYEKFKTFDLNLMYAVVKNKEHFIDSMVELYDFELLPNNFKKYEQALITSFEKTQKDKQTIEKIFVLANNLYVGKIELNEFKKEIDLLFQES